MSGKASPPAKISPRSTPTQNSSASFKTPTRTSVTPVDDLPIDSGEKHKSPPTSEINHDFDITMDQVKAYIKDFSLKCQFQRFLGKAPFMKTLKSKEENDFFNEIVELCGKSDSKTISLYEYVCYCHMKHCFYDKKIEIPDRMPHQLTKLKTQIPNIKKYVDHLAQVESQIKGYQNQISALEEQRVGDIVSLDEINRQYIDPDAASTPIQPLQSTRRHSFMDDSEGNYDDYNGQVRLNDLPEARREAIMELNNPKRVSPLVKLKEMYDNSELPPAPKSSNNSSARKKEKFFSNYKPEPVGSYRRRSII